MDDACTSGPQRFPHDCVRTEAEHYAVPVDSNQEKAQELIAAGNERMDQARDLDRNSAQTRTASGPVADPEGRNSQLAADGRVIANRVSH
jgi:hypothetical protein